MKLRAQPFWNSASQMIHLLWIKLGWKELAKSRGLRGNVGYLGPWVRGLRGSKFYVGSVGYVRQNIFYVGQHFT